MPKEIAIELSQKSIERAIKELNDYKKWVNAKTEELAKQLSLIGIQEASFRFTGAPYDGVNDVYVSTISKAEGEYYVYTIVAKGQAVCFIEFGAGVYHNTAAYPLPKPEGVVEIGEYGKGKGKQSYWGFYGENPGTNGWLVQSKKGPVVITRGNPASMPMYYASAEMKKKVLAIAREVFSS